MILFVLFGGSVGAVVFLHTQYGWEAVKQVDNDAKVDYGEDDDEVDEGLKSKGSQTGSWSEAHSGE